MTTIDAIVEVSRNLSRDFGSWFELNFATVGSTLKLPHPLVDPSSVTVLNNADSTVVESAVWALNARSGLVKLQTPSDFGSGVTINGVYYQWFLDEDLSFHAGLIATEHLHHRMGVTLANITGAEVEVMGIGALVGALWSLSAELSTDIDVVDPEGMNIPAHQRYQQVQQLIQYWSNRYDEKAALLNVGLKRIEMFTLRRVSRLTNRYVPLYRARELDNPRPPVRVRVPTDPIEPTAFEDEEEYWDETYGSLGESAFDLGLGGWDSIGSSGV